MSLAKQLDQRAAEWRALQPLAPADDQRLWDKLRLEWNYHSNRIEGNTLSYGETELLLIHDQVAGDHGMRHYVEMKAHDLAIEHLRKLVADERPLGEADIRDLNRILLKEPFRKDAITPDGAPTRIEIVPGEYKQQSNNVRTPDGGLFEFAAPDEVPAKMADLVVAIRAAPNVESDTDNIDLIARAAKVHHDFVVIHPFGDGNGRTARLLVNFLLLRAGWPPLVVPSTDKDRYLAALRQADAGDGAPLVDYLGECALTALERGIRAAKGETVEDDDDLEKEIEVFKRQHNGESKELLAKTPDMMRKVYAETIQPLFEEFVREHERFAELFHEVIVRPTGNIPEASDKDWNEWITQRLQGNLPYQIGSLGLQIRLRGFRAEARHPFDVEAVLLIQFHEFAFSIHIDSSTHVISPSHRSQPYSQPIPPSERSEIVKAVVKSTFEEIKQKSGET